MPVGPTVSVENGEDGKSFVVVTLTHDGQTAGIKFSVQLTFDGKTVDDAHTVLGVEMLATATQFPVKFESSVLLQHIGSTVRLSRNCV